MYDIITKSSVMKPHNNPWPYISEPESYKTSFLSYGSLNSKILQTDKQMDKLSTVPSAHVGEGDGCCLLANKAQNKLPVGMLLT